MREKKDMVVQLTTDELKKIIKRGVRAGRVLRNDGVFQANGLQASSRAQGTFLQAGTRRS